VNSFPGVRVKVKVSVRLSIMARVRVKTRYLKYELINEPMSSMHNQQQLLFFNNTMSNENVTKGLEGRLYFKRRKTQH